MDTHVCNVSAHVCVYVGVDATRQCDTTRPVHEVDVSSQFVCFAELGTVDSSRPKCGRQFAACHNRLSCHARISRNFE
jgi:hypothetical protein